MLRSMVVWLIATASAATAAERTIWQIGQPDRDWRELALAGNYAGYAKQFGEKPVVFVVGQSDPARHWPFIHPGPADTWAGSREHPFVIRFELAEPPRGVFTLRIELADTHGAVPPVYRVRVGKHSGEYRLPRGGGDASLTNAKAGKPHTIVLVLPPAVFVRGMNEIVLLCADGSWVQYDALALRNDPEASMPKPEIQQIAIVPTPFYVRREGRVERAVEVTVQLSAPATDLALRVEAAGQTTEVPIRQLPQLGVVSQEVGLPDVPGPVRVQATVTVEGRSRSATAQVAPQKKWRIFVAPSSHTDIGYTHLQPECAERHNQNIDVAMTLCEQYPDFRWNLEVAWQAENYLQARSEAQVQRFLALARQGRIGVQALYGNMLTGLCSHEEACRLTALAYRISRQHGIPYRSAMISDVPTQEASLPMILAGSGIRYFSSGINNTRAPTFTALYARCPAWWEGPDGSRVLMMWMPGYAHAAAWGLDQSIARARSAVLDALRALEARNDYPYDAVFLHGAVGDNQLLSPKLAEVVHQWNQRYEFPKILLCRNDEFFEHIEKHFGDKLPVVRGSGGTYWEDGAGSSARETALVRNAHETLAHADKLLALARRLDPRIAYPAHAIEAAWRNCLLYDEHTWGAHCSIDQPESEFTKAQWKIKAQFAVDADRQSQELVQRGMAALASLIRTDGRSLVVFNPSSWQRTDVLRVPLAPGTTATEPGTLACDTPRGTFVVVRDVPACGYRVVPLGPGSIPKAQTMEGTVLESRFYRLRFDPTTGAVAGIEDKESGRQLVDPNAPYRLNQYLYVTGGKATKNPENVPEGKLAVASPEKATLQRLRLGELGEMMIVETSAPMTPKLIASVIAWNHIKRIDLTHHLTKTRTYDKEAVYFAFPFAADKPVFRYEIPAGIVCANTDMLPGACLDWFTVQHFVEIDSPHGAVTWSTPDAPLVCFQDINRGKWQTQVSWSHGHLYAYVMNNYWFTNYLAGQGGEFRFRFGLTSRPKGDTVAAARFGWEVANPLLATVTEEHPQGSLAAPSASLLSVDEPNVLIVGVKQAAQGEGVVCRLREVAGQATTAHLRLGPVPFRKATACNLVEQPQRELAIADRIVPVAIPARGLATVLLE